MPFTPDTVDQPQGKFVPDVQENTTPVPESYFRRKMRDLGVDLPPISPQAMEAINKSKTWGEGYPGMAYRAGGAVADLLSKAPALRGAPAATAGYLTDVGIQSIPALFGGRLMQQTGAPEALQEAGKGLMQSAIKPSSTEAPAKVDRAINTMLETGTNPTRAGIATMRARVNELADQVNQVIGPSNKVISTVPGADAVRQVLDKVKNGTLQSKDTAAATDVLTQFLNHPNVVNGDYMTAQAAQAMKTANYADVGNAGYGIGLKPKAERDALKAVTYGLRTELEKAHPEVAAPNAEMSDLMNAINIVKRRAQIEGNKNPLSLGVTIASAMHNPASFLTFWANSSAYAKAMLARAIYSGSENIPFAAGTGLGALLGAQAGKPQGSLESTLKQNQGNK